MREKGEMFLAFAVALWFVFAAAFVVWKCAEKNEPSVSLADTGESVEDELPVVLDDGDAYEREPWEGASKIIGCEVTYYCCERYEHICGGGDGLTASGNVVVANYTCAVDPAVIPLGSSVWVDYGDGVMHEYIADDVGGAVNGAHIDIALETHEEALAAGRTTATVWWK